MMLRIIDKINTIHRIGFGVRLLEIRLILLILSELSFVRFVSTPLPVNGRIPAPEIRLPDEKKTKKNGRVRQFVSHSASTETTCDPAFVRQRGAT